VGEPQTRQEIPRSVGKDLVLITLPSVEGADHGGLRSKFDRELVPIRLVQDTYQYGFLEGGINGFEALPLILLSDSPMHGWRRALKRSTDVGLGLIMSLAAAPLMLCVAAAVKLTSRGPAFFTQERMGQDGKHFYLVKFRTMHADAEKGGPVWARNHDPRCTRIGAFLRRTSIDELPQLWNVLKGEMSLVGPRPERPCFVEEFRAEYPKYMLRHSVKSGMTGWAQVNGWRGNTSVQKRLSHDLEYIQNWSTPFDLKILWRTIRGGFLNKNAY